MQIVSIDQDHVRVVDHALSSEFCQHLTRRFEQCEAWHQERPGHWAKLIELDLYAQQLVAPPKTMPWQNARRQHYADFTAECEQMQTLTNALAVGYRQRWDPLNQMPNSWNMEAFRIKCYRPNGQHEFKLHTDAINRSSCTRFLAFLFYLSDSDAGTEFPLLDLTVGARQGRVCVFPPTWQYPHRGLMPTDGLSKYICSTYLHFSDE